MKYLLLILLFPFAAHSQYYDSTYKTTHDTTAYTSVQKFKDTSYNITVSVTHDTTIYVKQRRWFIFYYYKIIPVIATTTHDSTYKITTQISYYETVANTYKTTHDTTSKFYRAFVIHYGVLPAFRDVYSEMNAARNLGVNYIRDNIVLAYWQGNNNGINTLLANGYNLVLNINNDVNQTPFPKDLVEYENKLKSVFSVYKAEINVIENEELNAYNPQAPADQLYHKGSLLDYINELKVAIKVCHQNNLKVTNGGLTSPVVASLGNYYTVNGKTDSLNWLRNQMGGISKDPLRIARCDSLLHAYKSMDLDYVNLHWYEPLRGTTRMSGVLNVMINYLQQQTGKKVITNETGVRSGDPYYTTELIRLWTAGKAEYIIFYDSYGIGQGEGAYPLTDSQGNLYPTGNAFSSETNTNVIQ